MKSRLYFSVPHFAALLLLFLFTSVSASAQSPGSSTQSGSTDNPDEVLRVDTNLVTIPAAVMDRDGRYITDLKKEDFKIFENGAEQEIAFFAPVEKPFTVLLLLDVSGSMKYKMEDLARAANAFIARLRPDDQIIVASFAERVKILSKAMTVKAMHEGSIKFHLSSGGHTMLYDAVDNALKRMKKIQGRKAIVLFSDGYDSGTSLPFVTAKDNLREAEEIDAIIYIVQFNTSPPMPADHASTKNVHESIEAGDGYMMALAQKTGGRRFQIENISDLSKTFGQVADELRRQYSLGYYPKKPIEAGQTRHIAVKVRVPNLAVTARNSYIARKP